MQCHRIARLAALLLAAASGQTAFAAQVESVSPQGLVAEVRQIVVNFSDDVVPAGDPRLPVPFTLQCNGGAPAGDARWAGTRQWLFDLRQPLAAGQRCQLAPAAGFAPLGGPLTGPRNFSFSTGAPIVLAVQPHPGSRIEEDQHFWLRLNGVPDPARVAATAWCEVEGLGERVPVTIVEGAAREQLLRQRGRDAPAEHMLLLACQRPFPAQAGVRLVWRAGKAQRFEWKVRPRFTAEFSCEREHARAPCLPLRPLVLRFNAPVPRALADAVRLVPAPGSSATQAIAPRSEVRGADATVNTVQFMPPLPENMQFRVVLPAGLLDEGGRALANAGMFPLEVATGAMPPLAKFGSAPFGIVEAAADATEPNLLPLTLRHVQADLAGAATGGQVSILRFDAATPDATLLAWIGRLRKDHDEQFKTRERSLLAGESDVRRADLPQIKGGGPDFKPAATEVIGVPLPQTGYHVVEIESRILGQSLLASRAPMYARTGALVTGMAVHFKRGRSSSLVWVTTLARGRPVAGAKVAINDCRGQPLWSGSTDAAGIARIERGFGDDASDSGAACLTDDGLFVTARAGGDVSFVFSRWMRGIEPWRFEVPTARGTAADRRAHTVFDRTLLRAGETLSMKHFVRDETERGLALPDAAGLPTEVLITHVGSRIEHRLPLAWQRGARAAESRWAIPGNAALGLYDVALMRGEKRLPSGSFRVEAFRVPLIDAHLSAPSLPQVAPAQVAFGAQLNAMAGGPLAGTPLQLSALLRPALIEFPGFEDFSFEPPREPKRDDEAPAEHVRLVADKLAARTDAQGAARIVVAALPALKGPSDLQAELSFADPSGETQTVAQRLRLWPSAMVVGLRLPAWAAVRGEVAFTVVVLGTDGRAQAGRQVQVSGNLQQTFSTRKRIVGGFYAYDNRKETRDLGSLCTGRTDALGRLSCSAKLDASGEVELVASTVDDLGHTSRAAATAWLSGLADGSEWWFAQDNDDRIDLLPEKREVEPGETARLQVRMPFRQATALVTVEREGVIDARVVTLSGREPMIELPIPRASSAHASWAPNVTVTALVLRGRLRDAPWWSIFTWGWREPAQWWQAFRYEGRDWRAPTAMVDLAKPAFKLGVAQLTIGRAEHKLDVQVSTPKPQYGVRETVRATVKVSQGGKPAAGAEIAFAAVDEGLLALGANKSWDLLDGLLQVRPWGVETATAQSEIIGRRHYGRKALAPGGGGGRNPTRELFDTLLLWRGTVVLDARGEAQIDVPLNDSLTSFRLVAIADAGTDRFGTGSASVRVTQDLQMLPGLAPLARVGDRFDAGFTLRNTTARAMRVQATLAAHSDAGASGQPLTFTPQTVQLAAGATQEIRWPVTVPAGATRIDWQAGADEQGGPATAARDRVKLTQAVLPLVPQRVWQASLQALEGAVSLPMAPPADALPGSAQLVATLQPRLSSALPGLRRYFETYPYTCLEQKTSRAIALHDSAGWARLQAELPGYLDGDGLAGYFAPAPGSDNRGSDRLTAYLVTAAQEAGLAWPDAVRDSMLRGLAAFVEGRIERRFNAPRADRDVRKLAALDALAHHGRAQPRMLGSIAWTPAAWPTSALLDAWSLLRRVEGIPERAARLDEVQRLLRSRLMAGGTTLKFSTEAEDDWWWLMDGPDANAARLVLAATEAPAWASDVPQLVNGALARQRRGAWQTTTANLWGVLALERFAARFESAPVTGRSTLQLAGAVRAHDWKAAPEGGAQTLPLAAAAPFTARHEGSGRPWLTVQSLAAVPLREPLAAGYRITRAVAAVQRRQPDAWSRGDILRVRLEIEATADMSWVVLSDPLPAGAAVLGSGLGRDSAIATQGEKGKGRAWLSYEERAADAWRGYCEWLPRGRHVFEYTLRLNTAGRLGLPPTRVEAMYAPETFGELPNAAIEVRP